MSLFSAMRSGVSGLFAQSTRMAAISDNISNSGTVGYKRSDVDFSTMVTSSGAANSYSAGGVRSNVLYQVTRDGSLVGTQNATDLAIDGRGFFVVADQSQSTVAGGAQQFALTRAGKFMPDDRGFLRNSAPGMEAGRRRYAARRQPRGFRRPGDGQYRRPRLSRQRHDPDRVRRQPAGPGDDRQLHHEHDLL
jgi:flagellar hook protein FlgE